MNIIRKTVLAATATVACVMSSPVLLADTGVYIGAGYGISSTDQSGYKESTVTKVFAGYNFIKYVGLEAAYGSTGKYESSAFFSPSISSTGFQLSLVGYLPLGDSVSLFGKAGVTSWTLKASYPCLFFCSDSGTSANVGVGARFMFTKNVGMRVEVEGINDVGSAVITNATASLLGQF